MGRRSPFVVVPSGIGRLLRGVLDVESVPQIVVGHRTGRAILLNPRRLEIVLAGAAYPGLHLRSASRLLLQPLPSLRFHVKALKSHRLLETRTYFSRMALFVPALYPTSVEPFLVAWEDPPLRDILKRLNIESAMTIEAIANEVRATPASVARGADRLRLIGALRLIDRGRKISLSHRWRAFEALCGNERSKRSDRMVSLLAEADLHPTAAEQSDGICRFEVDGPRSRIRFSLPLDPLARERKPG